MTPIHRKTGNSFNLSTQANPKAQKLGKQFAITVKNAKFMKFPFNISRDFAS